MNERAIVEVIDSLDSTSITDALSANQGRVLNEKIKDTGWIDLPLSGEVTEYDVGSKPQYRKIGKVVYLRGAVKGITSPNTEIGVLPVGYRPSGLSHIYVQVTSVQNNSANFTRMIVGRDGKVIMQEISRGITATYDSTRWFPITTSFPID